MHLRALVFAVACAAVLPLVPAPALAAETVVVAAADGTYQPGLAASWTAEGDKVVLVLADGTDVSQLATVLRDRLAQAVVTVDAGKLVVTGIPMPALLEQLSMVTMEGASDPLAALTGLGAALPSSEGPEGGGSIRAAQPMQIATLLGTAPAPSPAERLDAEVVAVVRGAFPQVVLQLKVRRAGAKASLGGKLLAGKVFHATVLLAGPSGAVDYSQPATQRNLAGWYLAKGDRVALHAVLAEGGKVAVDWLERR